MSSINQSGAVNAESKWRSYDPTIEDSYSVTRHIDGQTYQLSLTDTAGQEEYRGLWAASNLKSADGFLLVYDITKADSLAGLEQFVELIEMESEHRLEFAQSSLAGRGGAASARGGGHLGAAAAAAAAAAGAGSTKMPPIKIIAGNKCDLARVRQVTSAQGLEYARSRGCGFMETSAKNMVNIEETFARKKHLPSDAVFVHGALCSPRPPPRCYLTPH
ncbi:MAG: hypothetical protein M1815_004051 [Lichina confinis]|nr:MAG: hypothetical protein M1815_004051 [Lichina confinis]